MKNLYECRLKSGYFLFYAEKGDCKKACDEIWRKYFYREGCQSYYNYDIVGISLRETPWRAGVLPFPESDLFDPIPVNAEIQIVTPEFISEKAEKYCIEKNMSIHPDNRGKIIEKYFPYKKASAEEVEADIVFIFSNLIFEDGEFDLDFDAIDDDFDGDESDIAKIFYPLDEID